MGKVLHTINAILIILFLISSVILIKTGFLLKFDETNIQVTNIYLWFVIVSCLIYGLFILISFFKTDIENIYYAISSSINIFIALAGIISSILVFTTIELSKRGLIESGLSPSGFFWGILSEGSSLLFLLSFPFVFLISFIIFLVGFFKNWNK